MAMTKKEREHVAALETELRTLAALRWTEPVARDVPPPANGGNGGYSVGFQTNQYRLGTDAVYPAWSSSVSHGEGAPPDRSAASRTGSQGSRSMYSTRLLALKALRHEVELEAAERLAEIDQRIAAELAGEA